MSLLDSLNAYWKLDESSGDAIDVHDVYDLTDTNTVGSAAGIIGNARDFEATNSESFSHSDTAALRFSESTDWAVSFWIKPESLATYRCVFGKWSGASRSAACVLDSAGHLIVFLGLSGSYTFSGTTLSAGTWYHVVLNFDASANELLIAVNGSEETKSATVSWSTNTAALRIGRLDAANSFDGLIDEFGKWDRLLTADERSDLYNSGAGLSYDDFAGVVVAPTAASSVAATIAPTVAISGVSFSPAAATAIAASIAPTVELGSHAVTPAVASAVASAAAPTVELGNVTLAPAAAAALGASSAPTVELGDVALTPTAASSVAATVAPSIELGALVIMPDSTSALAAVAAPSLLFGSLALTPAAAAAVGLTSGPIVVGSSNLFPTEGWRARARRRLWRVPARDRLFITRRRRRAWSVAQRDRLYVAAPRRRLWRRR